MNRTRATGWVTPEKRQAGTPTNLAVVGLVAAFGTLAFLAAPMMLVPFALIAAAAAVVCGLVAKQRGDRTWMPTAAVTVGGVMGALYVVLLVT